MANLQIKDLPEQTTSVTTDKVVMQDVANTTKYFTLTTLATFLRTLFAYKTSDYVIMKSTDLSGIKLDEASPDLAWEDLKGVHYTDSTGTAAPTFADIGGGVELLMFNGSDKCRTEMHIEHNDVLGGNKWLHPHVRMGDGAVASGGTSLVLTHVVKHSMNTFGTGDGRSGANPAAVTIVQTITVAELNAIASGKNKPFEVLFAQSGGGAGLLNSSIIMTDDIINITTTVTSIPTISAGSGTPNSPSNRIAILPIDIHRQVSGKPGSKYKDRTTTGNFFGTT